MIRKYLFLLLIYPLSISTLKGQTDPAFCPELVAKAKVALQQKDYDNARTFCESALNICPASGDTLRLVLKRIAQAIDFEKKEALKNARSAENLATAVVVAPQNPTLALRMLDYNLKYNPTNKPTLLNFFSLLNDTKQSFFIQDFVGHTSEVNAVSLSADGKRVLTGSFDKTAKLWDAETGKVLRDFVGHTEAVSAVSLSADGKRVLTGSDDNTTKLWDAETGKVLRDFVGHTSYVKAVSLSADGKRVLTGSSDNTAKLWDAETGKVLRGFVGHTSDVLAVSLSADGKRVLTGSRDKTAKLWDAETGKVLRDFVGHTSEVSAVSLSVDGKRVLTGSWDNTAKLWDAETGKALRDFVGHTFEVYAVSLSANGKRVLTGSRGNTAKLWDAQTGKVLRDFVGHTSYVNAVSLSADGKRVLTGSGENTVKLWDAETGKVLRDFVGHTSEVNAVSLSTDGKRVLTGSLDNKAKLWCIALDCEVPAREAYEFSLYTLAKAGLIIEEKDTPQYFKDSIAYFDKIGRDTTDYQRLMSAWKNSEEYTAHLKKIEDWESSEEAKQQKAKIKAVLKEQRIAAIKDGVEKLNVQIEEIQDVAERDKLYAVLIDTLERRFKIDTSYREALAKAYGGKARTALLLTKYKEAETASRKGLAIDAGQVFIKTNLGHALLFQGKYEAALKVYQDYMDDTPHDSEKANAQVLLQDLKDLETAGAIPQKYAADVAKIRAFLEKKE